MAMVIVATVATAVALLLLAVVDDKVHTGREGR